MRLFPRHAAEEIEKRDGRREDFSIRCDHVACALQIRADVFRFFAVPAGRGDQELVQILTPPDPPTQERSSPPTGFDHTRSRSWFISCCTCTSV